MSEPGGGTEQVSEAALAERYYDGRFTEADWGAPEPLEKPARLRVMVRGVPRADAGRAGSSSA